LGRFKSRVSSVSRETATPAASGDLTSAVRDALVGRASNAIRFAGDDGEAVSPACGKMLRTRFAARLTEARPGAIDVRALGAACAAIELAHTASLYHDDVIDNAAVRRGVPTLWRSTSPSAAVLIGDLLLSEAMELVLEIEDGRLVRTFISKVKEVCTAEVEQELILRGRELDEQTCVRLARQKTGPLFAFLGIVCGGSDGRLRAALEEAGYAVGTAYQLTDDLVDCTGSEERTGKTLGTDALRRKFTLAHARGDAKQRVRERVVRLCCGAVDGVRAWPDVAAGLERFLTGDLGPILERHVGHIPLDARCAI